MQLLPRGVSAELAGALELVHIIWRRIGYCGSR